MLGVYAVFVFLLLISSVTAELNREPTQVECPSDWTQVQSDTVKNTFDLKKIDGLWYEIAYHDLAQVRESCQYLNRTVAADAKSLDEIFGFSYPNKGDGGLALHYDITENNGVLNRYIDKPIVRKFQLPCAVVDATVARDGSYETISEYLCYTVGPITYREIRILSRSNTMGSAQLLKLENNLHSLGVPFKVLRQVDHSNCTYGQ